MKVSSPDLTSFNVTKGDYWRVDWSGFVYLPILDSPGNDALVLNGLPMAFPINFILNS